jgi:glycerol kinase
MPTITADKTNTIENKINTIENTLSGKRYVMAIDQGTTSSRAIVFDKSGAIIGMAQQSLRQIYPKKGWVEHDPLDILASVLGVYAQALVRAGISAKDLAAMGIANQRETTIVWEKSTGRPIYNAIVWQCRRTSDFCQMLKREHSDLIYNKTGLIPDAYFSASKLNWILNHVQGARERAEKGELLFGTVDTYLLWHFTKGKVFATDYTNAARTMLFNIHTLTWDSDLLSLFQIPACMLPEVHASGYAFGMTDESVTGAPVPLCGMAGDQQAALFGQLCTHKGEVKNTYGTGCFLLMNTGSSAVKSHNGLLTTLAASWKDKPDYVLEGSVFHGGSVVQWMRDEMKLFSDMQELESLCLSVPDAGGVYLVPAFTGLGAPYWDAEARGMVCGITRDTTLAHLVRAGVESIAYQVNDVLCAMEKDAGIPVKSLAVDGGACVNNMLMQFQADIAAKMVMRPQVVETTALGAAYLAGLTVGFWRSEKDILANVRPATTFIPTMDEGLRCSLLKGWQTAVDRTTR